MNKNQDHMNMNQDDLVLSISPLVSTEYGCGYWDGVNRELRLAFGTHVSPRPKRMEPASELEATLFYSIRTETRARLTFHYDSKTFTGD